MIESARGERYVVYDDVLTPEDFQKARFWFGSLDFTPVWPGTAARRISDGISYSAAGVGPIYSTSAAPHSSTGEVLGAMIGRLAEQASWLIGCEGERWTGLTLLPNFYPTGSRLSWHNDGPGRAGAYIYYLHPTWNASWGGELMLLDESATQLHTKSLLPPLSQQEDGLLELRREENAIRSATRSRFVSPWPNRLVVLQADTYHSIARVDTSAGENTRCAVTGFMLEASPASDEGLPASPH